VAPPAPAAAPELPSTTVEISKPAPPKLRVRHHHRKQVVPVPRAALKPVAEALDPGSAPPEKDNRLIGGLIGLAALLAGGAYWLSLSAPASRRVAALT
jgi:hypothetical protein